MKRIIDIIGSFENKKILVIGDIMLDRHIVGSVSRISPEAPVPVVLEEQRFETLGGAANVANNLNSLGAQVSQVGIVGADPEGQILKKKLLKSGIDVSGVFTDKQYRTVTKTRVMARHQQVVRIDRENHIGSTRKDAIQLFVRDNLEKVDAVIISDYGKGLIHADLVHDVCHHARRMDKIITVDPKVEHFNFYRQVTCITPNRRETENAIRNLKIRHNAGKKLNISNDHLDSNQEIDRAGQELVKYLQLESLLITLGEHGMRLFVHDRPPCSIPTHAQDVYDVTGAGDAVISVFTLALVAGATKKQAAELANQAAGIVVGRLGAVAVKRAELLAVTKK